MGMFKAACINGALYLVQFVALPCLVPQFFPRSNEAYLLFGIFALAAAGMATWGLKLWHLLVADGLYFLLILVYPAEGAYGIGISGIALDGMQGAFSRSHVLMGAMIAALVLLTAQIVLMLIVKAMRKIHISD